MGPAVNALNAFLLLLLHLSSVQSLARRGETYPRIVKCVPFSDVEGHTVGELGLRSVLVCHHSWYLLTVSLWRQLFGSFSQACK